MLKKIILICLAIIPFNVAAIECSAEKKSELLAEASVVEINYEEIIDYLDGSEVNCPDSISPEDCGEFFANEDNKEFWPYNNYLQINLINLNSKFNLEITNSLTDEVINVSSSEIKNGSYSFVVKDISKVSNYTFKLIAGENEGCAGEVLTTKYLTLPKYNDISEFPLCDKISDKAICQRFVTTDGFTYEELEKTYNDYLNSQKSDENKGDDKKSESSFFKEYSTEIIVGVSVLILLTGVTVIVIKKRSDLK